MIGSEPLITIEDSVQSFPDATRVDRSKVSQLETNDCNARLTMGNADEDSDDVPAWPTGTARSTPLAESNIGDSGADLLGWPTGTARNTPLVEG